MFEFIKSTFSESDGTGSFARVQSFVHGVFVLWWVTKLVYINHAIPDVATIGGLSAFILGPYSVNKVSTMFGRNTDSKQP